VLIMWQILSLFMPPRILPSPSAVFGYLWDLAMDGEILGHMVPSLGRIIGGFVLSMMVGAAIGIVMGLRRYWESFFSMYVSIALVMPSLTWAILGVMWFGMTEWTIVFGTLMITFPYVSLNVWEGVKSAPKDLVEMARSFRKGKSEIILRVFFPSLTPFLLAAVRYGFAMSWKIVVIAEMFVASEGVGYMIYLNYAHFSVKGILAWVLLFTILMIALEYGLFRVIERKALAWRPELVLR